MTQLELARQMGVTDKAVSKWERDLSFPDVTSLPKLAEGLGTSVDELLEVKTAAQEEPAGVPRARARGARPQGGRACHGRGRDRAHRHGRGGAENRARAPGHRRRVPGARPAHAQPRAGVIQRDCPFVSLEGPMARKSIAEMSFSQVYPPARAEGRAQGAHARGGGRRVTCWLTGYDEAGLARQLERGVTYRELFDEAPALNPNRCAHHRQGLRRGRGRDRGPGGTERPLPGQTGRRTCTRQGAGEGAAELAPSGSRAICRGGATCGPRDRSLAPGQTGRERTGEVVLRTRHRLGQREALRQAAGDGARERAGPCHGCSRSPRAGRAATSRAGRLRHRRPTPPARRWHPQRHARP